MSVCRHCGKGTKRCECHKQKRPWQDVYAVVADDIKLARSEKPNLLRSKWFKPKRVK